MEQQQALPQRWNVGSMVRAPYGEKHCRRAVIATLNEQEETAEVLFDASSSSFLQLQSSFLVDSTGKQKEESNDSNNEEEITAVVNFQTLTALHPWEEASLEATTNAPAISAHEWKERGDMLLQHTRDPIAAVSCYQKALHLTCAPNSLRKLQLIGSTILVIEGGHCVAAEVDCQEEDDDDTCRLDVTMLANGEEKTIPLAAARLVVRISQDRFQERALLNLARCCLQLAKVSQSSSHQGQSAFLHHAVFVCTLAFAVHEVNSCNDDAAPMNKTAITALLLRSQAQEQRGKLHHARVDMQRVLILQKDHPGAKRSLKRLKKRYLAQARGNRRLARDVSQWVQTAVSCNNGTALRDDEEPTIDGPADSSCSELPDGAQQEPGSPEQQQQQQGAGMIVLLLSIAVVFLALFFKNGV